MKRTSGSSMIEFALGLVVLAPVTVEVARWGAATYVLHEMQAAAARGAEFASSQPMSWQIPDQEFERRVRNVVLYGQPEGGGTARIPGLQAANVQVTVERDLGRPRAVEVSILKYEAPGGIVTLEAGPRVAMPYRGRISGYAP
jgi:hypothetical protein